MVLELTVLHILHQGQIVLRHKILIHVQQYVPYHVNAHLGFFPFEVEVFEETVVVGPNQLLGYGFQKLHRRVLDVVIEHLTMFVEHQMVGRPIQLLITQHTSLF